MLAAAGRLDGSRELEPAVLVDVRVLLQRRELRPARHGEVELREDGAGGRGGGRPARSARAPRRRPPPPPTPRGALDAGGGSTGGVLFAAAGRAGGRGRGRLRAGA